MQYRCVREQVIYFCKWNKMLICFFGLCNDWTDIHTDLKSKLANHTEVPKMPLKISYGRRTYRCLKKVIKKRQEERKKKSRKFTTEEDKNHCKHDKFIKLEFLEKGNFQNTTL